MDSVCFLFIDRGDSKPLLRIAVNIGNLGIKKALGIILPSAFKSFEKISY